MPSRTTAQMRRQAITSEISRLEQRLVRLESLPEEPTVEDGDFCVIAFDRPIGARYYTYVAVKCDNMWFYTGKDRDGTFGIGWDRLCEKFDEWGITEVWMAVNWETL